MATLPPISNEHVQAYQAEIAKNSSGSTLKRKQISLNKFFDWAATQGKIPANPMSQTVAPLGFQVTKPKRKVSIKTLGIIGMTGSIVMLIFLLLNKLPLPIPFVRTPAQESNIQTLPNQNLAGQALPH